MYWLDNVLIGYVRVTQYSYNAKIPVIFWFRPMMYVLNFYGSYYFNYMCNVFFITTDADSYVMEQAVKRLIHRLSLFG